MSKKNNEKNGKKNGLNPVLSQRVLNFLLLKKKMVLFQVAQLTKTTIPFLEKIQKGEECFTEKQLDKILKHEKNLFLKIAPELAKEFAEEKAGLASEKLEELFQSTVQNTGEIIEAAGDLLQETVKKAEKKILPVKKQAIKRISSLARKLCTSFTKTKEE